MYLKHHTSGIVIGGRTEGLDSRRVELFTSSFGLISAKVQGARLLRNKLRNGCQDLTQGEFSLVHGKAGWKVVSVRPDKNLFEIFRDDKEKLNMASNILGLLKRLVGEDRNSGKLFDIVSGFFAFLETAKPQDIALSECLTLMRILHELGYMHHDPELSVPISSSEITSEHLETISPRRHQIVRLINESLKAA